MKAAKFWVAAAGAVATSLLTLFGRDTRVGQALTVVAVVATAIGVYLWPNAPAVTPPADASVKRPWSS